MTIIAATGNEGKVKELREILKDIGEVISAKDASIFEQPEETGRTFTENAFIKAEAIMSELKKKTEYKDKDDLVVIADDSGLCVDILDGRPGVYSARYAGEGASDIQRVEKLLTELKDVPAEKRGAKFVCAAVGICGDGKRFSEIGETFGFILNEPKGENGFGYDPVFFNKEFNKSFAELTDEQKNSISHRGRAFKKLAEKFKSPESPKNQESPKSSRNLKNLISLNIVLVEPEIPQNTGNVARTCAATGAKLHLVKPFGFEITDKNLKRAGLDYWDMVDISYYDSFQELKNKYPDGNFYYSTTKAVNTYADIEYPPESFIVFGKETRGLPEELLYANKEKCIRIPMRDTIRSLNLANSVNIIMYEVYRQYGFEGLCEKGKLTKYTWEV